MFTIDKEIVAYAGSNIPVVSRKIFETLPNEERIRAVFTIAIANNARKAAKLDPLNPEEIVMCLQAMSSKIPILCSPNIKPIQDIKLLRTPIALLSGNALKEELENCIKRADSVEVKKYYEKNIAKFDNELIRLSQESEFGLIEGKYGTTACHPLNLFVKKIRSDLNQAMYINERASSFLYKSGEFEKPEPSNNE